MDDHVNRYPVCAADASVRAKLKPQQYSRGLLEPCLLFVFTVLIVGWLPNPAWAAAAPTPFLPGVAAAGAAASGVSNGTASTLPAAQQGATNVTAGVEAIATAKLLASENTINTQNVTCRLSNANRLLSVVEAVARAANEATVNGLVALINNPNENPARQALGHVLRLCRNGQLKPDYLGKKWFDGNQCIDNPATAGDFLKVFLDEPVLVPIPSAQLTILNNIENYTLNQVKQTLDGLNDKQLRYLGALRYCDNLVISRLIKTPSNNNSLTPANLLIAAQYQAGYGTLVGLRNLCDAELARRTALDPANAGTAGQILANDGAKLAKLAADLGYDTKKFYAFNKSGTQVGGPYISHYLADQIARLHALSGDCPNFADAGEGADKSGNKIKCVLLAYKIDLAEASRRQAFFDALVAIGEGIKQDVPEAVAARPASFMPYERPQLQHDAVYIDASMPDAERPSNEGAQP